MNGIRFDNCEVKGVTSRADGSVSVRFETAELRPSEAGTVIALHGKAVAVALIPHENADAPIVEVTTERDDKTPSQRLRAVLFVAWKEKPLGRTFEDYYRARMENFINHVKDELTPL